MNFESHDEVDAEGSWAVSYGDMITLLLTFFIVFFTLDPQSETKVRAEKLRLSLVGKLTEEGGAATRDGDKMNLGQNQESGLDREILKKWPGVAHDRGTHVIVEFPGLSFFRTAETDLTNEGQKALENFVKTYLPYAGNYLISIRAFADHRQVKANSRRRYKDNLELTALRSVSTMRVLQRQGIPLDRIRVGGHGELRVTAEELNRLPAEARKPSSALDLARTVVLVIEPEEKR